jgi:hypothetical protein
MLSPVPIKNGLVLGVGILPCRLVKMVFYSVDQVCFGEVDGVALVSGL